jgi:hypothetical protein
VPDTHHCSGYFETAEHDCPFLLKLSVIEFQNTARVHCSGVGAASEMKAFCVDSCVPPAREDTLSSSKLVLVVIWT